MTERREPEFTAHNGRRFAAFPAAVVVFVIDPASRRFLMMSAPPKRGVTGWESISGAMERGETPFDAAMREVAEEAGSSVGVRLLGVVDVGSFRYDDAVTHMLSIVFVAQYDGGEITPGDDMAGAEVRWMSLDEIHDLADAGVFVLPSETWLFARALRCFDLWSSEPQGAIT